MVSQTLPADAVRKNGGPARMRLVRQLHTYVGVVIAPSILFFAFTGALQLFGLHEAGAGSTPPVLVEKLAETHKNQSFKARPARPSARPAAGLAEGAVAPREAQERQTRWNVVALKWFFLAMSLGLMASTCLGLWVAVTNERRRSLSIALFVAGAVVPFLLAMP